MVWQKIKPYHNLYLYHPFPQLLYITSLSNIFNDVEGYFPRPIQLELIVSIVQESSILMGIVQFSILVFEIPIF